MKQRKILQMSQASLFLWPPPPKFLPIRQVQFLQALKEASESQASNYQKKVIHPSACSSSVALLDRGR